MADALIALAVESLGFMAVQELKLVVCVKADLESLSRTFISLQAALRDAENRLVKQELVRDWLEKLKGVAYDVDDTLEEWKAVNNWCDDDTWSGDEKVCARSFSPRFCFESFDRVKFQFKMKLRIKKIRQRLDEIRSDKDSFNFRDSREEGGVAFLGTMETSSLVDEREIFGRDRDRERIISWLVSKGSSSQGGEEEEEIPIICLVGMAGIGKTALAQLVCNDGRVRRHFDKIIWVSLSHDFDVMRIYDSIITCGCGDEEWLERRQRNLEAQQHNARATLRKLRCLLVLDGMYNVDETKWEGFMTPFKVRSAKSWGTQILVTARGEHVIKAFRPTMIQDVSPLLENDCWSLFSHKAFSGRRRRVGDDGDQRVKLEEIGREIAKRCQGVPLVAKVIGTALRNRSDILDWQSVLEVGTWDWLDGNKINIAPVKTALLMSFHDMPPHLKQCFAVCSIFPKEHLIDKDKLIKLWMAQGFILPQGSRVDMERAGGSYFDDLMRRSLFQIIETDTDGYVKYCKMHDMIHDLCKTFMSECFMIYIL